MSTILTDDWMGISTAPKDGTHILLFAPVGMFEGKPTKERVTAGSWIEHGGDDEFDDYAGWASWDGGFTEENPPTHWRPYPGPPINSNAILPDNVIAATFRQSWRGEWIPFLIQEPPKGRRLLVTNNLGFKNAHGEINNLWLVPCVTKTQNGDRVQWSSLDEGGCAIENLTHWATLPQSLTV